MQVLSPERQGQGLSRLFPSPLPEAPGRLRGWVGWWLDSSLEHPMHSALSTSPIALATFPFPDLGTELQPGASIALLRGNLPSSQTGYSGRTQPGVLHTSVPQKMLPKGEGNLKPIGPQKVQVPATISFP